MTEQTKQGHPTAAWVFGVFGIFLGLIPYLFIVALPAGIVALALGIAAYRAGRRMNIRQGLTGILTGVGALALGIAGLVITVNVMNDIDEIFTEIDQEWIDEFEADYQIDTDTDLSQYTDDDLVEMWADAPLGSDIEAHLATELEARDLDWYISD